MTDGYVGAGFGGSGVGRSQAGRLWRNMKRSIAVSFSATTVLPSGPAPISVIDVPMSPDACQSLYFSGVLKT